MLLAVSPAYDPNWSPKGNKIAFVAKGGIHVMNADGTNPVDLSDGSGDEASPDWGSGRAVPDLPLSDRPGTTTVAAPLTAGSGRR